MIRTAQIPDIWRTGSFLPILAPMICVHTAPGTHAQLPAVSAGWIAATVLIIEIDGG